jgi:hypothetical protein
MIQVDSLIHELQELQRRYLVLEESGSAEDALEMAIAVLRQHLADQADVAEARERLADGDFIGVEESEQFDACRDVFRSFLTGWFYGHEMLTVALQDYDYFKRCWGNAQAASTPATGWQPIETAPKDGAWILGYGAHEDECGKLGVPTTPIRWAYGDGWLNGTYCPSYPSHWMPLPPPPGNEQPMPDWVRKVFDIGFKAGGGTHRVDAAALYAVYEDEISSVLQGEHHAGEADDMIQTTESPVTNDALVYAREAIGLLSSMVESGERHSGASKFLMKLALDHLASCEISVAAQHINRDALTPESALNASSLMHLSDCNTNGYDTLDGIKYAPEAECDCGGYAGGGPTRKDGPPRVDQARQTPPAPSNEQPDDQPNILRALIACDVLIRNMRHRDARWHDDPTVQAVLAENTRCIQAASTERESRPLPQIDEEAAVDVMLEAVAMDSHEARTAMKKAFRALVKIVDVPFKQRDRVAVR